MGGDVEHTASQRFLVHCPPVNAVRLRVHYGSSLVYLRRLEDPKAPSPVLEVLTPTPVDLTFLTAAESFTCFTGVKTPGGEPCSSSDPAPSFPDCKTNSSDSCKAPNACENGALSYALVQLRPFPTYTLEKVTYEDPWSALLGLVGGIASLAFTILGYIAVGFRFLCPRVVGLEPDSDAYEERDQRKVKPGTTGSPDTEEA